jgi:hypothetical protein
MFGIFPVRKSGKLSTGMGGRFHRNVQSRNRGVIRGDLELDQLFTLIMGTFRFAVMSWKLSRFSFDLPTEFERNWAMVRTLLWKDLQGG